METLSNLASAATQAVWPTENTEAKDGAHTDNTAPPDPHSEPLSGATGNTARGEPYDAGNKAEQDAANAQATSSRGAAAGAAEPKGPGPKPIEEVAREHHGDAGRATEGTGGDGGLLAVGGDAAPSGAGGSFSASPEQQGTPATATSRSSREGGQTGTVAPVPSRASGPGPALAGGADEYVHSSGLQADGGDFDAARSGAGLEAERIREQKGFAGKGGVAGPGAETKSSSSGGSGGKEKKSLGEKIKAKIHRKD